jgi:hypothetical protein
MRNTRHWVVLLLILISLQISSCTSKGTGVEKIQPFQLEPVDGSDFKKIILTEKAAERLDIQTAPVRNQVVNGSQRKVIPYAAVMYGLAGGTFVYKNPEPLVFIRQIIVIDYIEGDLAVLVEGLDVDTVVVIVGAAELYGAEVGVSK